MYRLALFLLAAPLLAQNPGLDLFLLLENTPGMPEPIPFQQFAAIQPEMRVALMTFSGHSQVRQTFTSDPKKLEHALHRAAYNRAPRHLGTLPKASATVNLLHSVVDAARLFRDLPEPGRRRIIFIVFGTEDDSAAPAANEVKRALSAAHIQLYAVAVSKFDPLHARDSQIETPPTFPGRTPPVPTDHLPLPEKTLQSLQMLAMATGGQAVSGEGNGLAILRPIQSQ